MSRDPQNSPDPEDFCPERWLTKTKAEIDLFDPSEFTFGFGRRQCPGKAFADANVYLVLANIIATMDISKAVDENGKAIEPTYEHRSNFVSSIEPFNFTVRPRSQAVAGMITQLHVDH